MSKFFEDTLKGLKQAVEIEKGNIPMGEVKGLPAKTLRVKMPQSMKKEIVFSHPAKVDFPRKAQENKNSDV